MSPRFNIILAATIFFLLPTPSGCVAFVSNRQPGPPPIGLEGRSASSVCAQAEAILRDPNFSVTGVSEDLLRNFFASAAERAGEFARGGAGGVGQGGRRGGGAPWQSWYLPPPGNCHDREHVRVPPGKLSASWFLPFIGSCQNPCYWPVVQVAGSRFLGGR